MKSNYPFTRKDGAENDLTINFKSIFLTENFCVKSANESFGGKLIVLL